MKEIRLKKIQNFEKFYDNCNSTFTKLRDEDKRVEIFEKEYMLSICPGSRVGRDEKRVVEIFWGARPYEFETKGKQWKSLTETGATLFFYRNDTGDITISLYPAKTEFRQPIENQITLYEWIDPEKLNNPKFINSLWNDFIAYMECTSLDGRPTLLQRLRISYLKNFNHLVVDNKWAPTKFSVFMKGVLKLVLAACCSGAVLIYLVNHMNKPTTTETDNQLIEVNKNLVTVSKQLDKISESNTNIKNISVATDSIAVKTKVILETLKKH